MESEIKADTWNVFIGLFGLALKLQPFALWKILATEECLKQSRMLLEHGRRIQGRVVEIVSLQSMDLLQRVALDQYCPCLKLVIAKHDT